MSKGSKSDALNLYSVYLVDNAGAIVGQFVSLCRLFHTVLHVCQKDPPTYLPTVTKHSITQTRIYSVRLRSDVQALLIHTLTVTSL